MRGHAYTHCDDATCTHRHTHLDADVNLDGHIYRYANRRGNLHRHTYPDGDCNGHPNRTDGNPDTDTHDLRTITHPHTNA